MKPTFKIALINMPFANVKAPSLALTQLKTVTERALGTHVTVEIHYLNQDFARQYGLPFYQSITDALEHHATALGEWFFRSVAFPQAPDNADQYFARYYPRRDAHLQAFQAQLLEKRAALPAFLDELIERYQLDQADLAGFTSMFSQNLASLGMARRLKEHAPRLFTVMGGANCEAPMGQALAQNVDVLDFVFSGPALKNFPRVIQNLMDGEAERCAMIPGVISRYKCIENPPPKQKNSPQHDQLETLGEELDINVELPLDYQPFLERFEQYFGQTDIRPTLFFETSRGCRWGEYSQCTFCGLNSSNIKHRVMPASQALNQFAALWKYYPASTHFECVDNLLPKSYVRDVLPYLQPPGHLTIFYEVRADLSEDALQVLARANVNRIQPGIESLATSTLKLMRKGTTAFTNIVFLKHCVMKNVYPVWNLLIGFPGEEANVYEKYCRDMPRLAHLVPPSGIYPVRFDRYSRYFTQPETYGLHLEPCDYYPLLYPFSPDVLKDLAYYFVDRNPRAEYFKAMARWIGKLRQPFDYWTRRWKDSARDFSQPKLYFKAGEKSYIIYDSRFDQSYEYAVSPDVKQILDQLARPQMLDAIQAHFIGTNTAFEQAWAFIQEHQLLFEEANRYVSLVFPTEPPPQSSFYRRFSMPESKAEA